LIGMNIIGKNSAGVVWRISHFNFKLLSKNLILNETFS